VTACHIDFETKSAKNLPDCGLDNYITDSSTSVLLMAYCFEDEPVHIWEPHKEPFPKRVLDALYDENVLIWAYNAAFERNVFNYLLGHELSIRKFRDSMILARYMALPGSLDECGSVLGIDQSLRKMQNSDRLKDMFYLPAKEGGEETLFGISEPVFRTWETNPIEWQEFVLYCKQDVVAERAIKNRLKNFPLPDHEWEAWYLDQEINERGVMTDTELIEGGSYIASIVKTDLLQQIEKITQLDNPNSRDQLLEWLRTHKYPFHELGKSFVSRALLEKNDMDDEARIVLKLRQQSAKTSTTKLEAIRDKVSSDGRLRHCFSYLGASRTGRWSSGGGE
jgi:DNA polymerase